MSRQIRAAALIAGVALTLNGSALAASVERAAQGISPARLAEDVRFLSDDLLEGRSPEGRGGEMARLYIRTRFAQAGLEPGAGGGSWEQPVALLGVNVSGTPRLEFRRREKTLRLAFEREMVCESTRYELEVAVDAEVVFAGYGIVAPEQNWDDFKRTDVKGKVLLILVNDPPSEDPAFFGGKALTYYGRWTYKYDKAAALGAAGVLLIHTTETAGYGWDVVVNSFTGEQFYLADEKPQGLGVRGWLTEEAAKKLAALGGQDLDLLRTRARAREFKPVPLGVRLTTRMRIATRRIESANVIGRIPGSNPERAGEPILFTAHWDHLGIGREAGGDKIYNGALDNATGVAGLMSLAEAFMAVRDRLERPILLIATTAEESGLLGAEYHARHPVLPIQKTVANINLDGLNVWGPTRDLAALGAERSTLSETLEEVARVEGLTMVGDTMPEKGYFFRSDHFPFAKAGVPSVSLEGGLTYVDQPEGWGKQTIDRYIAERYHKPGDEMQPDWNFGGATQLVRFAFRTGCILAGSEIWPDWHAGQEFHRR